LAAAEAVISKHNKGKNLAIATLNIII